MAAKEEILKHLKANFPLPVTGKRLMELSGISEWARRIRELRAEGWRIQHTKEGYKLLSLERGPALDAEPLSGKLRYAVLHRDNSTCRRCGRRAEDGVRLVVDHMIPRAWGGPTELGNLWTLCEQCNLGKKHFERDVDPEIMKVVLGRKSGRARVLEYLKLKVGRKVTKEELIIVARIHDYPRRIRELREEGWDILSCYEDPSLAPGEYLLRSLRKKV